MRRWNRGLLAVVVLLSLALGWSLARRGGGEGPGGERITSLHSGPTIEQVRALAELVTHRVSVTDAIQTTLSGRLGSARAGLLVRGDYLLAVDLDKASFQSMDHSARQAVLVLPQPRVQQARLDHGGTRLLGIQENGLWAYTPSDNATSAALLQRAYRDAESFIASAGDEPGLLAGARQQAQAVLERFFAGMGWTVSIQWEP